MDNKRPTVPLFTVHYPLSFSLFTVLKNSRHFFQRIDQARAGPHDGFGDKVQMVFLYRRQVSPSRQLLKLVKAGRKGLGLRKQDDVGSPVEDFLQTHVRPLVLQVVADGIAARRSE